MNIPKWKLPLEKQKETRYVDSVACHVSETYSQLGILVINIIYLSSRPHIHRSSRASRRHEHQITKVPISKKKYTIMFPHCVPCVSHQHITVARHWGATLRSKRLGLKPYISRLTPRASRPFQCCSTNVPISVRFEPFMSG